MKLLTQIPREFLQANSTIRWQYIYAENAPDEIVVPLYAPLEAKAKIALNFPEVLKIKVAVYRRQPHEENTKFAQYKYVGDSEC